MTDITKNQDTLIHEIEHIESEIAAKQEELKALKAQIKKKFNVFSFIGSIIKFIVFWLFLMRWGLTTRIGWPGYALVLWEWWYLCKITGELFAEYYPQILAYIPI